ncbi:EipB family protein [Mangrovicella endophytica]|uniref:EipB family protein n=1 Tax=Mangrovicella endophytica TaxID=2066697 RepID=UPI0018E4321A|nr:DUF1849 family protein [Mangrovicella endophytica]
MDQNDRRLDEARRYLPHAMALMAVAGASMAATPAGAAELAPHRAVYELSLATSSSELVNARGRIAMELKAEGCRSYDLDYRFVAQFQQESEVIVTDQQTIASESRSGESYDFSTKTFIDGSPDKEVAGKAVNAGASTQVILKQPAAKQLDLPLSVFPMRHTADLVDRAEAGERIVQAKLFDGDDDAQKLLTTTAIILPIDPAAAANEASTEKSETKPQPPAGPPAGPQASASKETGSQDAPSKAPDTADEKVDKKSAASPALTKLAGMKAWSVSEAYYNSDSDPDGLPIFQTSYTLYANGVSDNLTLDFGTYAFKGSLTSLDLLDAPSCR